MENSGKENRRMNSKPYSKRIPQPYQDIWEENFPWLAKNEKGPTFAKCTFCKCDIKLKFGRQDIVNHSKRGSHSLKSAKHHLAVNVNRAETMIATFMKIANSPPDATESVPKLLQSNSTDSPIPQDMNLDNIRANFRGGCLLRCEQE